MSWAESHLSLVDSIVGSAERLCEGELCCLRHRRKVSALCLLYRIYHRVYHRMKEYMKHFVVPRNTGALVALAELTLVIPRCRTDQFSRSYLPAPVRLWDLLPSGTLGYFKSNVNLCLLGA